MAVIEIDAVDKTYRRVRGGTTVALSGLDLRVDAGGVFGFLGPNGSGKTTTIRILLGLARPDRGRLRLLGADVGRSLHTVMHRVGAIVESPAVFAGLTGRQNLRLLAATGGFGSSAVDSALERVGLADRADDRVKGYSLGMRQRLAVAQALLGDPEVLILDEPANGLDPGGRKAVRQLVRHLADEGRTVFVSSHLLAEVEEMCDHVAIITKGRCLTSGSVADIIAAGGGGGVMAVRTSDDVKATMLLAEGGYDVDQRGDGPLRVSCDPSHAAELTRLLAAKKVWVTELVAERASLEDVFLTLTATDESLAAKP